MTAGVKLKLTNPCQYLFNRNSDFPYTRLMIKAVLRQHLAAHFCCRRSGRRRRTQSFSDRSDSEMPNTPRSKRKLADTDSAEGATQSRRGRKKKSVSFATSSPGSSNKAVEEKSTELYCICRTPYDTSKYALQIRHENYLWCICRNGFLEVTLNFVLTTV